MHKSKFKDKIKQNYNLQLKKLLIKYIENDMVNLQSD